MKACTKCKESKEDSHFQTYKDKPVGQCRACKTAAMVINRAKRGIAARKRSKIIDGRKLCMGCGQFHSLDLFSPSNRGLGGKSAYCKPCAATRFKPDKQTMRDATQRYRTKNRPRWLSLHRLTQFKRRSLVAASSDGTVTDEFLYELYSQSNCHYCRAVTTEKKRTADHVIPLSKGGGHTASNLVMACSTCNSSKRDQPLSKFLKSIGTMP